MLPFEAMVAHCPLSRVFCKQSELLFLKLGNGHLTQPVLDRAQSKLQMEMYFLFSHFRSFLYQVFSMSDLLFSDRLCVSSSLCQVFPLQIFSLSDLLFIRPSLCQIFSLSDLLYVRLFILGLLLVRCLLCQDGYRLHE